METRRIRTTAVLLIASATAILGSGRNVFAGGPCKLLSHCKPSCEVFHSETMGYNPTCWRKFPPLPACPTVASATTNSPAVEPVPPAKSAEGPKPTPKTADPVKPTPKAADPVKPVEAPKKQ